VGATHRLPRKGQKGEKLRGNLGQRSGKVVVANLGVEIGRGGKKECRGGGTGNVVYRFREGASRTPVRIATGPNYKLV